MRVLHLAGSAVDDFYADLSRLYAAGCLKATADPALYDFHVAYVTPDHRWRFPVDLTATAIASVPSMTLGEAVAYIAVLAPDVVVPQMFCLPGMTSYRGLFDVLDIPYVGNTPDVMALGADKAKARAIVAAAGVDVPPAQVVRRGDVVHMATPAVVKPVNADNSLGVTLVRDPAGYEPALAEAFNHSGAALVEAYVELGREVRCGVLERDGDLLGLPLEEYSVDALHKPIRNHDDKIDRVAGGDLRLVAKDASHAWILDTEDPVTQEVWEAAKRCHRALGCRQYSLFDFRIDRDGRPWFLEASLYSSFSPQSVITVMAEAAGTPLAALFSEMIHQAVDARGGVRSP